MYGYLSDGAVDMTVVTLRQIENLYIQIYNVAENTPAVWQGKFDCNFYTLFLNFVLEFLQLYMCEPSYDFPGSFGERFTYQLELWYHCNRIHSARLGGCSDHMNALRRSVEH